MSQIFHRSTNPISKVSILGVILMVVLLVGIYALYIRSPNVPEVGTYGEQPVPFSHEHHVSGLGIDCRYCHTSVEEAAYAGMPPT